MDVTATEATLFEEIGRLYVECRLRARREQDEAQINQRLHDEAAALRAEVERLAGLLARQTGV